MPAVPPACVSSLVGSPIVDELIDRESAETAFSHLECRLLETRLLCDAQIRHIAFFWDLYLGRHQQVVAERLSQLGIPADGIEDLAELICQRLSSYSARQNSSAVVPITAEVSLFEDYPDRTGIRHLRCECCGYHFRFNDMSSRRSSLASDAGLILADAIDARREGDDLKPMSVEGKDRSYLQLEIDHDVPWSALGSATADNLRFLCRFCNRGKSNFAYAYESLSLSVASSLGWAYRDDEAKRLHNTVVAALRLSEGICSVSGATQREAELTVRFNRKSSASNWLMPWHLDVISYNALESE
jgi:hypothetical protein